MPNFDLRICYPFTSEPKGKKNKQKTKNFSALPALMIVSWTTSSMERSSKYDKLCNQMRSKNFTNEIFAFKVAGNSFFETPKDYIQSAQKPTFLLRGQTNFTRVNQRFDCHDNRYYFACVDQCLGTVSKIPG